MERGTMTTLTVTNNYTGASDSLTFPTEADAAVVVLWLRTEFTGLTIDISKGV
jgi:hypothetical protein